MLQHFRFIMSLLNSFRILIVLFFCFFFISTLYADVCVWRNPERRMTKIFPNAGDYKTIIKIISEEKRKIIEKRLDDELTPEESKDWVYYEITDTVGVTLGYIITDAEKGEYGVIEIVMGILPDGKVKGIYIQRAMEKDKKLKSKEFLEQFIGKTVKNHIRIGEDIKTEDESIAGEAAVILGVRKMLIFYDELGKK